MEVLKVLEDKVNVLLEKLNALKVENAQLVESNEELEKRCKAMESSLQADAQRTSDLDREKDLTKSVVDDLIKSIDALV